MRSAAVRTVVALVVSASAVVACDRGPAPSVDAGRDLYRQNGCVTCHGSEGKGDGNVAGGLAIRPRDFRDAAAFKQGSDAAAISKTIATGVVVLSQRHWPEGEHHNQVMPQFGHLSERERRSLALYVISLRDAALLMEKGKTRAQQTESLPRPR